MRRPHDRAADTEPGGEPGSETWREAQFAAAYREHAPAVYRLARRLVGNAGEAEDVVSETFVAAWRRWDDVVADARPPGPWLLGVAARQALNISRGRRRRSNLVALLWGRSERSVPDPADEVVLRLDEQRSIERTRRALGVLSAHEAEALALCVWSELSYADAAVAMGVSVASVRTRLARARRKLRAELSDSDASDPERRDEPAALITTTARSHA